MTDDSETKRKNQSFFYLYLDKNPNKYTNPLSRYYRSIEQLCIVKNVLLFHSKIILTRTFPMYPFSTHWKHQKTLPFSDVFMGWRKGALGTNGLNINRFISQSYGRSFLRWMS